MKKLQLLPLFALTHAATASVFVIGDGFELDGSDSITDSRNAGTNLAETSTLFNLVNNEDVSVGPIGSPFSSDPLIAGAINFGDGEVFQSGVSFDLSLLPSNETVTMIELFLEVAGTTFNNGVPSSSDSVTVDFFAGAVPGGVLAATPDATFTINNSDENALEGNFIVIPFSPGLIDLSTDSVFTVVLDAGSNPDTAAVFGSGLGPNVGLEGGTTAIGNAPILQITTVPEPSSALLAVLAGCGFLVRRRR